MKILFMGTPDFAAVALKALIEAGHEIVLVVTKPDKKSGRGGKVVPSAVRQVAQEYDLPVFQPVRVREPEAAEKLRSVQADIGVVAAFGQILSAENLNAPRLGCVNIHASLLPLYRGSSPIQNAILSGDAESGVTIMQMDEGVDTGDILLQESLPIAPDETAGSLFDKLAELGASLIVRALPQIEAGELVPKKQDEERATITRMISKEMGEIRWRERAFRIERQIRAMTPWPSAFTRLPDGRVLKIWKAQPVESRTQQLPGCVTDIDDDSFTVACGEGALRVLEVQLEGRKRMSVHDFLLGFSAEQGLVLV